MVGINSFFFALTAFASVVSASFDPLMDSSLEANTLFEKSIYDNVDVYRRNQYNPHQHDKRKPKNHQQSDDTTALVNGYLKDLHDDVTGFHTTMKNYCKNGFKGQTHNHVISKIHPPSSDCKKQIHQCGKKIHNCGHHKPSHKPGHPGGHTGGSGCAGHIAEVVLLILEVLEDLEKLFKGDSVLESYVEGYIAGFSEALQLIATESEAKVPGTIADLENLISGIEPQLQKMGLNPLGSK